MGKRWTDAERAEAVERLRAVFPAGSSAWTVLRHVSRSGMLRGVSVVTVDEKGRPWDVSFLVARALDYPMMDGLGRRCLRVGGAGMDMGFHVVYGLSRVLHGDGYAVGQEWL